MMNKHFLLFALLALATIRSSQGFSTAATAFVSRHTTTSPTRATSARVSLYAVKDIGSEPTFDDAVKNAGSKLVVVDYSTTWCGPCKVIAPKFEELSEKYSDAVFLKVIGDASPEASKLMKREGVRSVPSFHYFMNGSKVDVVNGANAEAIEAAITKHLMTA
jgi:thioredoxin 1